MSELRRIIVRHCEHVTREFSCGDTTTALCPCLGGVDGDLCGLELEYLGKNERQRIEEGLPPEWCPWLRDIKVELAAEGT